MGWRQGCKGTSCRPQPPGCHCCTWPASDAICDRVSHNLQRCSIKFHSQSACTMCLLVKPVASATTHRLPISTKLGSVCKHYCTCCVTCMTAILFSGTCCNDELAVTHRQGVSICEAADLRCHHGSAAPGRPGSQTQVRLQQGHFGTIEIRPACRR